LVGAGFTCREYSQGDFVSASWLLGSGTPAVLVGVVVWAIAGIGFIGAAVGFWQGAEWWRSWAWVGSIFTLVAIGLWFGSVPVGVYVGGALAIATIVYLVVVR
jgi:hypothetical protein